MAAGLAVLVPLGSSQRPDVRGTGAQRTLLASALAMTVLAAMAAAAAVVSRARAAAGQPGSSGAEA